MIWRSLLGEGRPNCARQSLASALSSPSKTQKLVLTDPAFVVPRFESRDWSSTERGVEFKGGSLHDGFGGFDGFGGSGKHLALLLLLLQNTVPRGSRDGFGGFGGCGGFGRDGYPP